uniref:Protein ENL-like n=1 Tax=Caenorhabditis tropicalis TaxID=1561998 RepID=A0A1I7UNW8_9PELO
MNKDTKQRSIDVDLFSSRFVIVEGNEDKMKISTVLQPDKYLNFKIKDKGFNTKDPGDPCRLDGFVQITVAEDSSDSDQENPVPTFHFLPRLRIDFAAEEEENNWKKKRRSFRMRESRDEESNRDEENHPLDKLICIKQLEAEKKIKTKTVSSSQEEPETMKQPKKKTQTTSSVTPEDEVTPKSLKLKDVVFSDHPPKPPPLEKKLSSDSESNEKKTSEVKKVSSDQPKKPISEMKAPSQNTKKLEDVVFPDKPKISENAAPKMNSEDVKKVAVVQKAGEIKRKKKKNKKCVIS